MLRSEDAALPDWPTDPPFPVHRLRSGDRTAACRRRRCAPSRATLLTGEHSQLHGQIANHANFDQGQRSWPRLLQAAGYRTAIVGKTHLAGRIQGFDHRETRPGQGVYYEPDFQTADGRRRHPGRVTEGITQRPLRGVAGVDRSVGRILDYPKHSGLDSSTVVTDSSDQGFFLGGHGWFDKGFIYEEAGGAPLIVRWPACARTTPSRMPRTTPSCPRAEADRTRPAASIAF